MRSVITLAGGGLGEEVKSHDADGTPFNCLPNLFLFFFPTTPQRPRLSLAYGQNKGFSVIMETL